MEERTFSRGMSFWYAYLTGRPQIPDSLLTQFYSYHAANGGKFDDVNDVGAGLGNLSLRLAERFSRVVVTEPSERTLRDAETFIKQTSSSGSVVATAEQFSFVHAAAEEDALAPASIDAIFCLNTVHWVDLDHALPLFAKQLVAGGTLFLAMTGIPVLTDPHAQSIWQRLLAAFPPGAAAASSSIDPATWRRAFAVQDSGYDAIEIPGNLFEPEVQRLRLNASRNMYEFARPSSSSSSSGKGSARGRVTPVASRIGEHDEVRHEHDESWFFTADLQGLADMAAVYLIDLDRATPDVQALWEELAAALHDKGGHVGVYHPVSIIMATRR